MKNKNVLETVWLVTSVCKNERKCFVAQNATVAISLYKTMMFEALRDATKEEKMAFLSAKALQTGNYLAFLSFWKQSAIPGSHARIEQLKNMWEEFEPENAPMIRCKEFRIVEGAGVDPLENPELI